MGKNHIFLREMDFQVEFVKRDPVLKIAVKSIGFFLTSLDASVSTGLDRRIIRLLGEEMFHF